MKQLSEQPRAKKTVKRPDLARKKMPTEERMLSPQAQERLKHELLKAIAKGSNAEIKKLLRLGADVNTKENDSQGKTALMLAACYGHVQTCILLIEKGADVNARDDSHGWTALIIAPEKGRKDVCMLLLDKGADVNATDNYGWTALMTAASHGKTDICELLVSNGADIGAEAKTGNGTALMQAEIHDKKETAAFLTFASFAPRIFADKEASGLFYSTFSECIH